MTLLNLFSKLRSLRRKPRPIKTRRVLELESLEGRVVLSGAAPAALAAQVPVRHSLPGAPNALWIDFGGMNSQAWGWSEAAKKGGGLLGSTVGSLLGGPVGGLLGG